MIVITIDTDNDAFADDHVDECKRIIKDNIDKLYTSDFVNLYDLNGNKVGYMEEKWNYITQNIKKTIRDIF